MTSTTFFSHFRKLTKYTFKFKRKEHPSRLPILFVHNPKTAGTSFRYAALGSKKITHVLCDYGKDNPNTTPALNRAMHHPSENSTSIEQELGEFQNFILTGHFSTNRYVQFFYPYEIGLFVRDPIERFVSNYYHKIRKEQFDGSLMDFCTKHPKTTQSKLLGKLPPQYFGFIGISERYSESLDMINSLYRLDLKPIAKNLNPEKKSNRYDIPEQIAEKILKLSGEDTSLYDTALKLFDSRSKFLLDSHKTVYGSFNIEDMKTVSGRAYRAYTTNPVSLDLNLNGKLIAHMVADLYDPIPCNLKQPRNGNIGFTYTFKTPLDSNDRITVTASDSGEPIFNFQH